MACYVIIIKILNLININIINKYIIIYLFYKYSYVPTYK